MKIIIFLLAGLLMSLLSHSQTLTGYWEGKYCFGGHLNSKTANPIALNFELKDDGTYFVTSYTENSRYLDGSTAFDICAVSYFIVQPDSIYVVETAFIKSPVPSQTGFQKMALKIHTRKKRIELSGNWWSSDGINGDSGKISFWKKRED